MRLEPTLDPVRGGGRVDVAHPLGIARPRDRPPRSRRSRPTSLVAREPEHVARRPPRLPVAPSCRQSASTSARKSTSAGQERLRLAIAPVTLREQRCSGIQIVLDEAADHGRRTIALNCAEDSRRNRAPARRRACARGRAVPRGRQQPRLPRLLRAARGARDERRLPDERAPRLHEHALQAAHRLPAESGRRRVGHAPDRARGDRHDAGLQGGPARDGRPAAGAVPVLPPDRRGVRLPQPRVRGLGGRRRDRDARHAGRRERDQDVRRLDRPRRLPARLAERLA